MSETSDQIQEPAPRNSPRFALKEFGHPVAIAAVLAGIGFSLAGRFLVRSPMWLDEALSVNISKGSLSSLPEALRHDGHPPLYYVLLHFWMSLFGDGTTVVRALSGVISLLTVPLAWMAGTRLASASAPRAIRHQVGASVTVMYLLSPFVLRYASETRMYSLVIAEVFLLFIALTDSRTKPARTSLIGVAVATAMLLWTHYWSMWLLAAVGLHLVVELAVQKRRGEPVRRSLEMLGALVVGGLAFGPWLPVLLSQSQHTGTPWSPSLRPTTMAYSSFVEFAGGPYSESQLLLLVFAVLIFLGATGASIDSNRIEVDLRTRVESRIPLIYLTGTMACAAVAGLVTGMAFAPRYAAVFLPFFVLLVGLGLSRIERGRARDVALVAVAALSVVGMFLAFTLVRSQSRVLADTIRATAPNGIVIACPDQLGPPVRRELQSKNYEVVAYPRLDDARVVDWYDYAERNRRNDPIAVAHALLAKAGDRPIFVAYRDDFLTLKGQCSALISELAKARQGGPILREDGEKFYEPISAVSFPPPH